MAFQVTGNRTPGLVSGAGTTVYLERNKKFPTLGRVPEIISKWIKELNFFKKNIKTLAKKRMFLLFWGDKVFKTCHF